MMENKVRWLEVKGVQLEVIIARKFSQLQKEKYDAAPHVHKIMPYLVTWK